MAGSVNQRNLLFLLVGVTGFEPATPTSRTKSNGAQPVITNDKQRYVKDSEFRDFMAHSTDYSLSLLIIT